MSIRFRGRRNCYDNIAVGSAMGRERPIANTSVSKVEMYGGGFRTSTSTGDEWHTNVMVGSSVTDQAGVTHTAAGAIAENPMGVGVTNTDENVG
jgi:hypothetical protein